MLRADRWRDYEVLDCAGGEKLERWGDYFLVRPDPQVIWRSDKKDPHWRKPDAHYHRSNRGGGDWEFFSLPKQWDISYALPESLVNPRTSTLRFQLKPFRFKHTGLFPEQAANWDRFSSIINCAAKEGRPARVLNLFAYTGGATLAAAAAGAEVTHVDASKGMVAWAKENAESSGLSAAPIRWLVDDCGKFVQRELRRGRRYDAIIMDPPSYGRGPNGELWKLEDTLYELLTDCVSLLSDTPLFFLISSYTTGLQASVLSYLLGDLIVPRFGGKIAAEELGLPVSGNGLTLPCGASGLWIAP